MDVGIRALRDGLSRHLEAVKAGETINVTEHGRTIARITPVSVPSALDRLRAEGRISEPTTAQRTLPTPVKAAGGVSDLVAEQRR